MKKAKRRKKQFRLSRRRVSLYASFCVIVLYGNRGYFTISYDRHQRYAHPYTMTLAKYKQLNDFEK